MPGTYKTIEVVGTSSVSFAEAVKAAVVEAAHTVRQMDWFEVVEQRGRIADGKVEEFPPLGANQFDPRRPPVPAR